MLHRRILRSSLPHAEVRSIDSTAAAQYPGVRAMIPLRHTRL
jgi:CO/xanthine dehydrogenase Mo-binding subunit